LGGGVAALRGAKTTGRTADAGGGGVGRIGGTAAGNGESFGPEAAAGATGSGGTAVGAGDGVAVFAAGGGVNGMGCGVAGVLIAGTSGGVGMATRGVGTVGTAAGVATLGAVAIPGGAGANSSSIGDPAPTMMTPPHTEQRARTPSDGTFVGSTRKTELHSGHETFTCPSRLRFRLAHPPRPVEPGRRMRPEPCRCGGRSSTPIPATSWRSSSSRSPAH